MEIIRALTAFILMTSVVAAETISVGTAKGIGTAATMIAVEKGYYKELGLDVRVE